MRSTAGSFLSFRAPIFRKWFVVPVCIMYSLSFGLLIIRVVLHIISVLVTSSACIPCNWKLLQSHQPQFLLYFWWGLVHNHTNVNCYPFIVLTWVCTYTYQNWHVGCNPDIWSKVNSSYKERCWIKAELVIFPLHYSMGVNSTSTPRTDGEKLSKVESLLDFGRRLSLPKTYIFHLATFSYLIRLP